jgi:hypothetical protein
MAKGTSGNLPPMKDARGRAMKSLGHSPAAVRQMRNKASAHHAIARGKAGGGDSTAQGTLGTGGGMAGPNILGG